MIALICTVLHCSGFRFRVASVCFRVSISSLREERTMLDHKLLTEYGAADVLGITPERIRQLIRNEAIPVVLLPGGIVRFDPIDLRDFICSHRRPFVEHLPIQC